MKTNGTIPENEVQWANAWQADLNGRLFLWNNDLYRAIYPENQGKFEKMFATGLVAGLVESGLIPQVEITPLRMEGYGMVLKHSVVPFVSYPYEWSPLMLKDAARAVIDLNEELMKHGFSTYDCHPFNVVFDGPTPKYVDIGSFSVSKGRDMPWDALPEFYDWYLRPLSLYRNRHLHRAVQCMFREATWGISEYEYLSMSGRRSFWANRTGRVSLKGRNFFVSDIPRFARLFLRLCAEEGNHPFLAKAITRYANLIPWGSISLRQDMLFPRLRKVVEGAKIRYPMTQWSEYHDETSFDLLEAGNTEARPERLRIVERILAEIKPGTVLDIGANQGLFSILASKTGARVVSSDSDIFAVDRLYERVRAKGYRNITTVVMSLNGIPQGWQKGLFCKRSAPERFRSEMVMALALTHHLSLSQSFGFDAIASIFSEFSERYLITEYMPNGVGVGKPHPDPLPPWYTLDNFLGCLGKHFSKITTMESSPYPTPRIMVVCEK